VIYGAYLSFVPNITTQNELIPTFPNGTLIATSHLAKLTDSVMKISLALAAASTLVTGKPA
jgi:hypothetical protein